MVAKQARGTGREVAVGELERADLMHRIRFRRPANSSHGSPVIWGVLLGVAQEPYWQGNMQKTGYSLQVGFPSKWGGFNRETFGPVPAYFAVELGRVYRPGPTLYDRIRDEEEQAEIFVAPQDVPADVAAVVASLISSAKDSYLVSFFGSERVALAESAGYTLLERELPVISTLYEWRSGVKLMLIRNELLAEYRADGIDPLNSNDAKLHHFAVPKTREQLDGDPRLEGSVY